MSDKRYSTRIDVFSNIEEYEKFMEFARKRNPKTKADMIAALEAYKQADLVVDEHKERVEAKIMTAAKKGLFKPPKEQK